MSIESTPSACLLVLRNALVQRRRQTAKTAWDAQSGDRVITLAADLGVKLKAIQDAIDAVDKAILDEHVTSAADLGMAVDVGDADALPANLEGAAVNQ